MTRTLVTMLKGALCAGAVAACLGAAPAQAAQVEIQIGPPRWYVATTRPVYHEGRASYWYGNRWHYREGRNWRTYREEPPYLRQHRQRRHDDRQADRHYYGRDHDGGFRRR